MSAGALGSGRRERTRAANRAALLDAAARTFAEIGYGEAGVRDISRRADLASGTFYNYFSDKEAVFRALVEEVGGEIRARVHAARSAARTPEEFVAGGFRAFFAFVAEDPVFSALMRRNGGTVRALYGEATIGTGVRELRADLDRAVSRGWLRPHDTELMAAAMVGAGVEVALRMVERDPPDVAGATRVISQTFTAGLGLGHPGGAAPQPDPF